MEEERTMNPERREETAVESYECCRGGLERDNLDCLFEAKVDKRVAPTSRGSVNATVDIIWVIWNGIW